MTITSVETPDSQAQQETHKTDDVSGIENNKLAIKLPFDCERKAPLSSTSHCSADAKSIMKIKAELEALTLEAPSKCLDVKFGQTNASEPLNDDMRRICSQNYSSDALSDAFKRVTGADHVSVSTQETTMNNQNA